MVRDEWVEVFSTTDEGELLVVESLLKGEGIATRRRSSRVPQLPLSVDGLAETALLVAPADLERAIDLMVGALGEEDDAGQD